MFAAIPAVAEDSSAEGAIQVDDTNFATEVGKPNFNVILKSDIVLDNKVEIKTSGTIDLGNYTISSKAQGGRVINVMDGANVVIKSTGNGSIVDNNAIYIDENDGKEKWASPITVINSNEYTGNAKTKLTVESGTITSSAYGISVWASCTLDITGGTINSYASTVSGNGTQSNATVNISGGQFTSTNSPAVYWPSSNILNVTGGTFTGIGGFDIRNVGVTIKNATINVVSSDDMSCGSSGPASFPVGIGVYAWQNNDSYGTPAVTIENITVTGAGKICDVYYGVLTGSSTGNDFATATAIDSITSLKKSTTSLTIKDDGKQMFKLDNMSAATAVMLDLGNNSITALEGSVLNCNVIATTYNAGTASNSTATITGLKAGSNGVTFSQGSVVISGTIASGSNVEIKPTGAVKIGDTTYEVAAGSTTNVGGITISNTGGNNTVEVIGKLIIPKNSTLTISSGAELTINSGASLVVGGTVTATDATLTNNGTISVTDQNASIPDSIPGTGSVDTSAVASEGTLSGSYDTTTTFTKNQIITATGDITLVKGTVFTFEGQFIIPEGITVTVEDGAQLVIAKATGKLVNNGTIVVESSMRIGQISTTPSNVPAYDGGFVINGGNVENAGNINLEFTEVDSEHPAAGWVMNFMSGILTNTGSINVGEDSEFVIGASATLKNEGTVQMNGELIQNATGVITSEGSFVISGKSRYDIMIYLTSEDATVQVDKLENLNGAGTNYVTLTVSDQKYLAGKNNVDNTESEISLKVGAEDIVSGATIGMMTKKVVNGAVTTTYKMMTISGTVAVDTEQVVVAPDTPTVAADIIVTGDIVVSGDLAMGEKVNLYIGNDAVKGDLTVTGTITGAKDVGIYFNSTVKDEITVTGKITLLKDITVEATDVLNAAKYDIAAVGTEPKQYVYTSFETAVADGAKKIAILGTVDVENDVTVPAGTTVTNSGILNVDEDATVKFVTGAVLKNNGTVNVDGVLFVEDKKNGLKPVGTIVSDVIIEGETSRTYTNVMYALSNAKEGETVKLSTATADAVVIDKDVTIPAGVTLDTNTKTVTVEKNVTVTVDGTLYINGGSFTLTDAAADSLDKDAKIVLNGTVKSNSVISADLAISGAYYAITVKTDKTYYVQPVETAAPNVATYDIDDGVSMTIVNYGETALKIGDITLAGTDAENTVVVGVKGDVVAKSITLDNASIDFADAFSGTIASGVGSVNVNADTATGFRFTATTDGDVEVFAIAGDVDNVTDGSKFAFTVEGEVSIISANVYSMTVDGKLIVADTKVTISTLTINGEVFVDNDAVLDAPTVQVYGTLSVAEQTSTDGVGTASVDRLLVGISKKAALGASASVTGNVDVNVLAIVADGSSIAADIVKDKPFTEYYIENALYVTAYDFTANNSTLIDLVKYKVENADANGWAGTNGPIINEVIGEVDRVDANIRYDVYGVKILSAEGVIDITIDRNLYNPNSDGIVFLTAGAHKVEYTLDNGWTGTATLAVNGAVPEGMDCTIDGTNFTISGDFDETLVLQLTGIEKSGFVPDAPDSGDNGGMTITDYLLIILVVLIVVMAIIVAMRLMRS